MKLALADNTTLVDLCRRSAKISLLLVIALCMMILLGWSIDNHNLTSMFPTLAGEAGVPYVGQVQSSAAIGMIFLSLSLLFLMSEKPSLAMRIAGYGLAAIALSTGLLNCFLELSGEDIEPLRLLQPNNWSPGITFPVPMVIQVSIALITVSLALLLFRFKLGKVYPREMIALFSILCPILVLGGASTKIIKLCVFGRCYTPSIGFAVLMLLFAFALFLSRPNEGIASAFTSNKPGGIIIRRAASLLLVPIIYLVSTIPSHIVINDAPMFNLETCHALAFGIVSLMIGALAWSGWSVANQLDSRLEETAKELERTRQSRSEMSNISQKFKRLCLTCTKEFDDSFDFCPDDGTKLDRVVDSSLEGSLFAEKYEIMELLGSGGMSSVYRARHTVIENEVAIKILLDKTAASGEGLARFMREARALGGMKHPGIVGISDFGVNRDGRAYLIMEYVRGKSLAECLKEIEYIDVAAMISLVEQLCEALHHAHGNGIVHRDLKPGNIMLLEGNMSEPEVRVVDFGLAKIVMEDGDPTAAITQTGECVGSPLYMSPEQCLGDPLDYRSDLYSLGCILYEILTGTPPIIGRNAVATIKAHVNDPPAEFPKDSTVPAVVREIIFKCLEKEPSKRPDSALEIKETFLRYGTYMNA